MAAVAAQHMQELKSTQQADELGSSLVHAKSVDTSDTLPSLCDTESTCSNSLSQSPQSRMKWADMVDDSEDESDAHSVQTWESDNSLQKQPRENIEKHSAKLPEQTSAKRTNCASFQHHQFGAENVNYDAVNQYWGYQQNGWGGSKACNYAFVPVQMAAVSYCWPATNIPALDKKAEGFTVVVRNIPNKYTRDMFVKELNRTGFQDCFDFVYVPIDPETEVNKGYAFINFINTVWSDKFTSKWEDRKMENSDSAKRITVAPAVVQGFNANYHHFCDSQANRLKPSMRPLFIWEKDFPGITSKPTGKKGKLGATSKNHSQKTVQRTHERETADSTTVVSERKCGAATAEKKTEAADSNGQAKDCVRCCGVKILPTFKFCPMCGKTL